MPIDNQKILDRGARSSFESPDFEDLEQNSRKCSSRAQNDTQQTMEPPKKPTDTKWNVDYDISRREKLFRNPPRDHTAYPALQQAVNPHIESFNAIFGPNGNDGLLAHAITDIGTKIYLDGSPKESLREKNKLSVRFKSLSLQPSVLPPTNKFAKRREVFPAECRERHVTYRGKLSATLEYRLNNGDPVEFSRELGNMPIMIKSNRCHLENNSPELLVQRKEESEELGGYFVVNGIEKIIRLLIVNKRNFPLAIKRGSFKNRGPGYTEYGIIVRSVRPDETSQTNVLHYLADGTITFRFSWRKNEYLIPAMMILKALIDTNDKEICGGLVGRPGSKSVQDAGLLDRVEMLLRSYKPYKLYTQSQTRAYLGEKFRVVLGVPETWSHYRVGTEFLRKVVLVHLGNANVTETQDHDKFNMLLFMMRKLYSFAAGDCAADNPDCAQNQEVLLGGFLYGQIIKERLDELLTNVRHSIRDYFRRKPNLGFTSEEFKKEWPAGIFRKTNENLGQALEYFLSTGNLVSTSGLDLQQTSGFTVVAEKLNFPRFISHFRMVHRGAFFAQLKTTSVRRLLGESWGFLCPVHTPDGPSCGILNHLAHKCIVTTKDLDVSRIPGLVAELGVGDFSSASTEESVPIMLDGRLLGYCTPHQSRIIHDAFRHWKVKGIHGVPLELEIGYVPPSRGGSYAGVYMASHPARMIRPVEYLALGKTDFVGPHEQVYMLISAYRREVIPGVSTHLEEAPGNILSIMANMTPWSDHNQSPRNIYQCQMAKQTLGTPGAALRYRTDNKLYRLQSGQTPIARSPLHNAYGMDNFPNGTNAIVAVIAYTGYDMDDAMIINKSAHERGFAHGTIYKTKKCSIKEEGSRSRTMRGVTKLFGFAPGGAVHERTRAMLDDDGLPRVGSLVKEGDYLYAWHAVQPDHADNLVNRDGVTHFEKYKDSEDAFIEEVRLIGNEHGTEPLQMISIKFRIPRAPVIGDKFASRHGQKGVCSQLWPSVDMPWTESGMQPDIIINPHAFPSRMTIGMFVESLAGKSGALHGLAQDSSPFKFGEDNMAADYFGEQLRMAGYNFHGNEPMYSGITGEPLQADIYIGVVYYQRLRHMVNDKYQVRTTGPVVPTTGQPVGGRKRGGGIRVGEMERDSLLAHGASFLLQDRLLNCSDYLRAWICRTCGSFLSVQPTVSPFGGVGGGRHKSVDSVRCRKCARKLEDVPYNQMATVRGETWEDAQGNIWIGGDNTTQVAIPGVLKYLDVELAGMGLKLKFRVSPDDVPRKGKLIKGVVDPDGFAKKK